MSTHPHNVTHTQFMVEPHELEQTLETAELFGVHLDEALSCSYMKRNDRTVNDHFRSLQYTLGLGVNERTYPLGYLPRRTMDPSPADLATLWDEITTRVTMYGDTPRDAYMYIMGAYLDAPDPGREEACDHLAEVGQRLHQVREVRQYKEHVHNALEMCAKRDDVCQDTLKAVKSHIDHY